MSSNKFQRQNRLTRGFTVIELLVVVAVIGILVSVVLSSFVRPRSNSRDARREADMKEVQNALGLYINDNGTYPTCGIEAPIALAGSGDCVSVALIGAGAMSATPHDPLDNGNCDFAASSFAYCYESDDTSTDYALYYHLETNSIAIPSGAPVAGSPGWYFINP